jgi:ABC-type enterobactin transport system permease subunit
MDERHLDMITQVAVAALCLGVAGFISLIACVALFGPQIAPLMNKLPW